VGFEGGEIVPVVFCLRPGETETGFRIVSDPCFAGLVVTLRMEGCPAKLGDGGELVDADSSFEHGDRIAGRGGIVISNDNPLGNSLRDAPLIAIGPEALRPPGPPAAAFDPATFLVFVKGYFGDAIGYTGEGLL
jgi:hypothetical protein